MMELDKAIRVHRCPKRQRLSVDFICPTCQQTHTVTKQKFQKKKNLLCYVCYQKSPERKTVGEGLARTRDHTYLKGSGNGNFKGSGYSDFVAKCPCGESFTGQAHGTRRPPQKYCSTDCKKRFCISHGIITVYKGIKFRSTWEARYAEWLDRLGYTWSYEPRTFSTPFGYYTPDFYVEELKSFVEVKGVFRKDSSRSKYEHLASKEQLILADRAYLENLGFVKVKRDLLLPTVLGG